MINIKIYNKKNIMNVKLFFCNVFMKLIFRISFLSLILQKFSQTHFLIKILKYFAFPFITGPLNKDLVDVTFTASP